MVIYIIDYWLMMKKMMGGVVVGVWRMRGAGVEETTKYFGIMLYSMIILCSKML